MADQVPLHVLLPARLDGLGERVRARLSQNEQAGGMKLAWGYIGDELRKALEKVLDCDLLDVLAKAWAEAGPLAQLAAAGGGGPGQRSVIELGGHDFSREFQPVVAVTIGSCPCVELKFNFTVSAHVGGVRLAVIDGNIIGGDLGEVWASAQLSYEGMPLHPAAESRRMPLPASFQLAPPGIAIPMLSQRREAAG